MRVSDASVRAASLTISALLLGAAVLTALTATIGLIGGEEEGRPITSIPFVEPLPEPPPPTEQVIRTPVADTPLITDSLPLNVLSVPEASPTLSFGAFSSGPPLISNPAWTRRPADLARYYRDRARRAGIEGQVLLDCVVSITGQLACAVLSETPPEWGFAAAAQRIARDHRMRPATQDGVPIEGRYRMRVPFEVR